MIYFTSLDIPVIANPSLLKAVPQRRMHPALVSPEEEDQFLVHWLAQHCFNDSDRVAGCSSGLAVTHCVLPSAITGYPTRGLTGIFSTGVDAQPVAFLMVSMFVPHLYRSILVKRYSLQFEWPIGVCINQILVSMCSASSLHFCLQGYLMCFI